MKENEIFQIGDFNYLFTIERDDDAQEPWKRNDGHGVVSEWTTREKAPHERVLAADKSRKLYYDWNASIERAVTDCWGIGEQEKADFKAANGRDMTKREIYARAVQLDFERLAAWCRDDWFYIGIVVTMVKLDEDAPKGWFRTKHQASLWGIESDAGKYLLEVVKELAGELEHDYYALHPKHEPVEDTQRIFTTCPQCSHNYVGEEFGPLGVVKTAKCPNCGKEAQ